MPNPSRFRTLWGCPVVIRMSANRAWLLGPYLTPIVFLGLALTEGRISPGMAEGMFITCLYAVLDPASGRLRFANAGYNLPYRRHAQGVLEMRATGRVLGMLPDRRYEEREAVIAPGDRVLFYSDGVVEAHNQRGDTFGAQRPQAFLTAQTGDSAARGRGQAPAGAAEPGSGPGRAEFPR